ncbi:MAG TPA: helix-turn-helix transcriptional regulator [Jatrophihabitantaceae bacterium]|nr:helix-turn-helix transcriptional regulator [Jatrophihabitantaceae bacterium]
MTTAAVSSLRPRTPTRRDPDELRRAELSAFLRSRRERLAPAQVGVTAVGRRRTPGLRREEVAQLAGVGVTWYTWLEQGRDIKVSDQVLEAIARTLLLDRDERAHLFRLAGSSDTAMAKECAAVSPQLHATLARLEPFPACVINGKSDILAYNRVYARLISDLDAIPIEERNCLWLLFADPAWRKVIVDWDDAAMRMTANLRVLMAEHVGEPAWKGLVARLRTVSPEFAELWARHDVQGVENKSKRFRNPLVGMLKLDATNTWLAPRAGTRLQIYTPGDADTERKLGTLLERIEAGD